jgi:hypothetical protein
MVPCEEAHDIVMAGRVPAIDVFLAAIQQRPDARHIQREDARSLPVIGPRFARTCWRFWPI